ncbi:MAG: tetratricopeptide repeat protein, partial [Candidatus Hydrogenedentota bacterium]
VAQDDAEAVKWYRKAAEQDYADAQLNLGVMYRLGEGVVQDYVRAHMWLNLAASAGDADAREARDAIAGDMTQEQIAEAQRLAREWQAQHQQPTP